MGIIGWNLGTNIVGSISRIFGGIQVFACLCIGLGIPPAPTKAVMPLSGFRPLVKVIWPMKVTPAAWEICLLEMLYQ